MNWPQFGQKILENPSLVIGGLATILAAVIGYKGVTRSLLHHRERERKAREDQMRRDVYFKVAEEAAKMVEHIIRSGDYGFPDAELFALISEAGFHNAKLYLVGNIEVIRALNRFSEKALAALYKLIGQRNGMMHALKNFETFSANVAKAAETPNDGHAWSAALKFQRDSAFNVRHLSIRMREQAAVFVQELIPLQDELTLAMRRNLEFGIASDVFLTEMKSNMAVMAKIANDATREDANTLNAEMLAAGGILAKK